MTNRPRRAFVTLADLHREGCNLWVQCRDCQRINTLIPWVLNGCIGHAGQYDEGMETKIIADLVARMKCSRCGSREIDRTPMCNPYR